MMMSGTGTRLTFSFGLGALIALALASSAVAATATVDIGDPSGPLSHVYIGTDLSCQVDHTGDTTHEFFPSATNPGDCGTFLATGGTLYTPDFGGHGPTATGFSSPNALFTGATQTPVTGSGAASAPRTVTTSASAGSSGLGLSQTDTYVAGNEFYRSDVVVSNTTGAALTATLYHAGDCFLQNSDRGYGFVDTTTGGIFCTVNANNSPPGRVEGFIPYTSGSHYLETYYGTVWSSIKPSGAQFPDTCHCVFEDNGAGLSWPINVPAGGSTTVSFISTFSPTGIIPPTATTQPATGVTGSGATLNGTVNAQGSAATYHFEYGTSTTYGSRMPATDGSAGSDTSAHPQSQALTGLAASTTYHYRIAATNAAGTTYGQDVTFTTPAAPKPATAVQGFKTTQPPVPPKPKPLQCTVPNLHHKTVAQARRELQASHCELGKITRAHTARSRRPRIISQALQAGGLQPAGTRVDAVLSSLARAKPRPAPKFTG